MATVQQAHHGRPNEKKRTAKQREPVGAIADQIRAVVKDQDIQGILLSMLLHIQVLSEGGTHP